MNISLLWSKNWNGHRLRIRECWYWGNTGFTWKLAFWSCCLYTGFSFFFVVYFITIIVLQIIFWWCNKRNKKLPLLKNCLYWELFWSVFSRIRTEYGGIRSITQCTSSCSLKKYFLLFFKKIFFAGCGWQFHGFLILEEQLKMLGWWFFIVAIPYWILNDRSIFQ